MTPLAPIPANTLGWTPRVETAPPATSPLAPAESAAPQPLAPAQPGNSAFANLLDHLVSDVNSQQQMSARTVDALQSGKNVSLHQAVISMEEANLSFQLMVQVRNKLLDAYQEIMRMQI